MSEEKKILRNIQQQVEKNANDIARFQELTGGVVGVAGPQGPRGPQGYQGEKGEKGTVWNVGENPPTWDVKIGDLWLTTAGSVLEYTGGSWRNKLSIQGPQGPVGEQGPIGPIGPQGPQGEIGPQGPIGESFIIKGPISSIQNLPDPTTQPAQTAYLVGTAAPYFLYVISEGLWVNAGSFASLDNIQVIILNAPDSATEGTLTADEVNKLANNDCILVLGNHVFHKTEDHADDGYWEYASFDNSFIYIITVMTAGSWVKNSYNNDFIPDSSLSTTSAEPVENRVITAKFNELVEDITTNAQNIARTNAKANNSVKYSEVESELNSNSTLPVQNKVVSRKFSLIEDDIEINQDDIIAIKSLLYFYIYNNNGYLYVDYLTTPPNFSVNSNGELIYEGDLNLSRSANNIILTF